MIKAFAEGGKRDTGSGTVAERANSAFQGGTPKNAPRRQNNAANQRNNQRKINAANNRG